MATWTNNSKSAAPTYTKPLKHGTIPTLEDLQSLTFNDTYRETGILVKDLTFDQFQQAWTNISKS